MKKKNVLHLSHTDLDGIGCQVSTYNTFFYVKNFNSTYKNVTKNLKIIDEHLGNNHYDLFFITDLSFTLEDFKFLYEMSKRYKEVEFIYIDHHPYDFDLSQFKDSISVVSTEKHSASLLTLRYVQKFFRTEDNTNKDIELFIQRVNAYDIWLKDSEYFFGGRVLNDLFWSYGLKRSFNKFKKQPHNITNKDKEEYKKLMKKKNDFYEKQKKNKRLFTFGDKRILVIFIEEFMSNVTIDFPDYDSYVIVTSYGSISVRLDNKYRDSNIKNNIIGKFLKKQNVLKGGGHHTAFNIILNKVTANNTIKIVKEVVDELNKELDNYFLSIK